MPGLSVSIGGLDRLPECEKKQDWNQRMGCLAILDPV